MPAFAALAAALLGAAAHAQPRVLGAQDCEKCHKAAHAKWKTEEPRQFGAEAHAVTERRLATPAAARYAAAAGLADPRDANGRCVECHATVVRGRVRGGVSCESCHGPASLWNPVHDKEPFAESYRRSVPLGMRDLHGKPAAIAAACVGCHVTPDAALRAAGHPAGEGFDAGASLAKLVHWSAAFTGDGKEHARYDAAQVSAAARPLIQKALARAAAQPQAAAARALPPAPPAAAAGGPAPWDWDQPVPALPDDYPSDAGRPVATASQPGTLSIAPEPPLLRPPALERPPATVGRVAARSAAAEAARLRGQGAELLAQLLEQGRRAPGLPPARKPQEFKGPDSELLSLQDAVLYLALEVLRTGGAAPPAEEGAPR